MSSTTASSWYRRDFYWDNDGRMSFFAETVVPYFSGGPWGWLADQAVRCGWKKAPWAQNRENWKPLSAWGRRK